MNRSFDRRSVLRASALAGGGLLLPGCATLSRGPRIPDCTPLAPVLVDQARVIRTVAGLRPYRASGFVVRREQLGDKVLVHNYGHGGAGITLSWGSSRLAVDLALAGTDGPVAVIGSGVMGLTTARLLQEAGRKVTIYTAALPPDTTSAAAGGQVSPFGHFSKDLVTPAWMAQFQAAMAFSWMRFGTMVGDRYGIRWQRTFEETRRTAIESDWMDPYYPNARMLRRGEHPFPFANVLAFDTLYVETPRFMAQLMSELLTAGCRIQVRKFETMADLATLPETVILNCTGIGARALVGDDQMIPVRGQLAVLKPQPEVRYAVSGNFGYMFPRGDGILLGGTFERGEWDATPQPADIARIIESHRQLAGSHRCTA